MTSETREDTIYS